MSTVPLPLVSCEPGHSVGTIGVQVQRLLANTTDKMELLQLLAALLHDDPATRPSASVALQYPYVSAKSSFAQESAARQQQARQRKLIVKLQHDVGRHAQDLSSTRRALDEADARARESQAEADRRQEKLDSMSALTMPPAYWDTQDVESLAIEECELPLDEPLLSHFTSLIRDCILDHPDHKRGCAPRGRTDIPSLCSARVTRVVRVENMRLWKSYCHRRVELQATLADDGALRDLIAESAVLRSALDLRDRVAGFLPGGSQVSDRRDMLSDLFLFHGTTPTNAKTIASHGFDERVAKNGGLYGTGSYFTDHSCKAQQYTGYLRECCKPELTPQGEHCMLVCRVQMGSTFSTDTTHRGQRRPPDDPCRPGAPYDSIFAEMGRANWHRQVHNEFVVFRPELVYPEFILYYTV